MSRSTFTINKSSFFSSDWRSRPNLRTIILNLLKDYAKLHKDISKRKDFFTQLKIEFKPEHYHYFRKVLTKLSPEESICKKNICEDFLHDLYPYCVPKKPLPPLPINSIVNTFYKVKPKPPQKALPPTPLPGEHPPTRSRTRSNADKLLYLHQPEYENLKSGKYCASRLIEELSKLKNNILNDQLLSILSTCIRLNESEKNIFFANLESLIQNHKLTQEQYDFLKKAIEDNSIKLISINIKDDDIAKLLNQLKLRLESANLLRP